MDSLTPTIRTELLEELLKNAKNPEDIFGPDGLLHRLKGALMQRMLEAEMSEHLGFEPNDAQGRGSGNSRNGHTTKTVQTETGPVPVRVPRDRNGTFEPKLVPKHRRRLEGFDEKVLALYARGMSTRDIQEHLRELYGTDVAPDLISRVTESVLDEAKAWQQRLLEPLYSPRWTEERLRVAEALETLPKLQLALRDGEVPWSTARELTRVANPENEHDWLLASRGRTLRQVEQLVTGHKPGDHPNDPTDRSLERHILRMEVTAETFATYREAMAKLRRESHEPLNEDTALLLMARQILGGPTDEGRASYQVAITTCRECNRGWQQGRGEQIEVASEIVDMATCDAQRVGSVDDPFTHVGDVAPARPRARQDIPPAVRRQILRRDGGRCIAPGCRNAVFLDLHHLVPRSEGGDHDPDTLVTLCSAHHRAQHRGQLVIQGRVSTGLVFRHADGSSYGGTVDPIAADTFAQAFRALCGLGFRERQTRDALASLRTNTHVGGWDFQRVIRAALAVLTQKTPHSQRGPHARGGGRSESPKNLVRLAPPPP